MTDKPKMPEPARPGEPNSPFPGQRKSWWSAEQMEAYAKDIEKWAFAEGYGDGYRTRAEDYP